jgi:hypothetical protein
MEMVKLLLAGFFVFAAPALQAADFSLTIGSPVALKMESKTKAALAVRFDHCSGTATEITGFAEGLVKGDRQSVPLSISAAPQQRGAFLVTQTWPAEGVWVVRLSATCGPAKAGALVPFDGPAFVREASKFFPRFPTASEVEAMLNARAPQGGR